MNFLQNHLRLKKITRTYIHIHSNTHQDIIVEFAKCNDNVSMDAHQSTVRWRPLDAHRTETRLIGMNRLYIESF